MESEITKSLANLEGRMLGLKVVTTLLLRTSIRTPEEYLFFRTGLDELFDGIGRLQAFHNEEIGEDLSAGLQAVQEEFRHIIDSIPTSEPQTFHAAREHINPVQTAGTSWWPWR